MERVLANLFQMGVFTLNSGKKAEWKIECDALTDEDWKALARMVRNLAGCFTSVVGIPRGGLKLASALQSYCVSKQLLRAPALVVDDVLTTGNSLAKTRLDLWQVDPRQEVIGVVVFARGPCPPWVKAVFQMPESLWL